MSQLTFAEAGRYSTMFMRLGRGGVDADVDGQSSDADGRRMDLMQSLPAAAAAAAAAGGDMRAVCCAVRTCSILRRRCSDAAAAVVSNQGFLHGDANKLRTAAELAELAAAVPTHDKATLGPRVAGE